jgi:hypothetical protein
VAASGNRSCTALIWTEKSPKNFKNIHGDTSDSSLPLRILTEADGVYIVSKVDDKEGGIYFVPRAFVSGMKNCPKKTSSQETS